MKQVASILHEEGSEIVFNIKSVQQQQDGTDCGVFAIAFLTSMLNGDEPSKLQPWRKLLGAPGKKRAKLDIVVKNAL